MRIKKTVTLFLLLTFAVFLHAESWKLNYIKARIEAGDYKSAAMDLRPLAEQGDAEAQYLAAGLFREGKGVIKSDAQAEKYYKFSAMQLYKPAIADLADFYEERKMYAKEYALLKAVCDHDGELLAGDAGFALGRMLFEGKGVEQDMERGWEIMFTALEHTKSKEYAAYMKEHHMSFFNYFIDKYATDGNEDKFVSLFVKPYVLADWHDEVMEAVMSKVTTMDYVLQEKYLNRFKASKPLSVAECYFLACMYYHGYGVPASLASAKKYAWMLDKYYVQYPVMAGKLKTILNEYYAGEIIAEVGKVERIEGDSVILQVGYREKKLSKAELNQEEVRARTARAERAQRKRNMTAVSRCPQILAGKPSVSYNRGTLEVTIPISLKAMNKCTLTAYDAKYKDAHGRLRTAFCRVVGLKTVGSNYNCLMPRETAFVTVYIKGVRGTGELGRVSATLKCNYGVGTVSVDDVVW